LQPNTLANIAPDDLNLQHVWLILILHADIFAFGKEAHGFIATFSAEARMIHAAKGCA